ncbi:MAG: peptidoglycan editing factor PgeF [Anaerolineales bacterium]|nr:peptidoglycan editing factor PgeF [Anaerolineales bacterium]
MIEVERNGLRYFEFESLRGNGRIQHAIFSRRGGISPTPFTGLNMSLSVRDDEANVFANREQAYKLFGRTNETLVHAFLVHGDNVANVTHKNYGEYVHHVDGLITNEPGCGLTMNFADCTPIFLYDPVQHAIGLGHAGWKGAIVDLPGAMVRAMAAAYGSKPADLIAGIGPCIGVGRYEVGDEVITAVHNTFADPDSLLLPSPNGSNRPHFDLVEANRRNLARAGVQQIELSGFCTAERTDLFFSHRAEKGKTGRFGTIFVLK